MTLTDLIAALRASSLTVVAAVVAGRRFERGFTSVAWAQRLRGVYESVMAPPRTRGGAIRSDPRERDPRATSAVGTGSAG